MPTPSRLSSTLLALLTPLGVVTGCITNQDLRVDDNDQFTHSGRATYEIYPGNARRRAGNLFELVTGSAATAPNGAVTMKSAGVKGTISIDAEIAAVEGKDHQNVPLGQQVKLDNEVIEGPARVKTNAENLRGSLAARGGLRLFDVLSLEAITGIGVDSTRMRMRGVDVGITASDEDLIAGFLLGGRATIRPIALFDIYAQYTWNINFGDDWKYIDDTTVGVELNLIRYVALFGGYRWWRYEESFNNESDWEIKLRGPTAGVALKF
ncbi:MAG TPA: hypothetical protein VFY49_18755 [Myxococcota bacterium]|nr:hypothetical protein [Myxococcota bacterium]